MQAMPVQTKAQVLALLQEYHQELYHFGVRRCGVFGSFARDTAIHPQSDRDRLIHNYFGIDYDIVWDVVVNKIPTLDAEIRLILKQEYPQVGHWKTMILAASQPQCTQPLKVYLLNVRGYLRRVNGALGCFIIVYDSYHFCCFASGILPRGKVMNSRRLGDLA
jgi:predicted nucleotidyltransferase